MSGLPDYASEVQSIEESVQGRWRETDAFRAVEDCDREKFYCLSMFPYPSGNLHVGHVRNYAIGDAIARYQRMLGKNVLQPMGWDGFGLPAENAAIENGVPPSVWTRNNIGTMRTQLQRLGFAYDWQRELATCDESYYRWEQWLFTKLMERDLVYRSSKEVNWDPVDNTVLANEQVIDGKGWRSGATVERRQIPQWFLKITAYSEELLQGLEDMHGWPESVRVMQRNWIGRSQGLEIDFAVAAPTENKEGKAVQVYTTRPDTVFGVVAIAVSTQHELARAAAGNNAAVQDFIDSCQKTPTGADAFATLEKDGMPIGAEVIHPLSGAAVPVWVANFVLAGYGTGAVMVVPAHDERDYAFAKRFSLPVRQVVFPDQDSAANSDLDTAAFYSGYGKLANSGQFDGLSSEAAFTEIAKVLENKSAGRIKVNYRLHDWGVSRQRYWGCPIPVVFDQHGTAAAADLPVQLPEHLVPQGGSSPLAASEAFMQVVQDGQTMRRESDTFDTFVESSWYYARFCCPDNDEAMLDARVDYWLPVDQYIGGVEHAVMHLLYARFFHKLLRDIGLVRGDEPFTNLLTQGMVLKDGVKMSKSRGNTVDPQSLIDQYGADTVRLYTLFAAPPEQNLEWSDDGISGAWRFLNRLWRMVGKHLQTGGDGQVASPQSINAEDAKLRRRIHETVAKVSKDFNRRYTFNTAIAAVMELCNDLGRAEATASAAVMREGLTTAVLLLAPIVPHITDVLWRALGHDGAVIDARWPQLDQAALHRETREIAVQINGKLRATIEISDDLSEAQISERALAEENIKRHIAENKVERVIVVPGRVVNIVVRAANA